MVFGGIGVYIAAAACVGMAVSIYGLFGKVKQSRFITSKLQKAASTDAAWDEASLKQYA